MSNYCILGNFVNSERTLSDSSVLSELGQQLVLPFVHACLANQDHVHTVRVNAFLNNNLTSIVDFLLKLFADIGHRQAVILLKKRHFNLQVHTEVKLLFFRLFDKLFAHNQAHAIRVCLLQALELNLVEVVLLIHIFTSYNILINIFFARLVKKSFYFHFPSHIILESLIHSGGLRRHCKVWDFKFLE